MNRYIIAVVFAMVLGLVGNGYSNPTATAPKSTPRPYAYPVKPPPGQHPTIVKLSDGRVVHAEPDGAFMVHQWELHELLTKGWRSAF